MERGGGGLDGALSDLQDSFQAQQPLNLQGSHSGVRGFSPPPITPGVSIPSAPASPFFLPHRSPPSFHSAPFHRNLLLLQVPSLLRTPSYVCVTGCGGSERPLQWQGDEPAGLVWAGGGGGNQKEKQMAVTRCPMCPQLEGFPEP